jgi:hypothetical protein
VHEAEGALVIWCISTDIAGIWFLLLRGRRRRVALTVEAIRTLVDITTRLRCPTSHKNVMLIVLNVRNSRNFNRRLPYLIRFDLKAATVMVIVKEVTIIFHYFFMLYNILSECIILGNSISFLTFSSLLMQRKVIDNSKSIFLRLKLKWNCICYLCFVFLVVTFKQL